MDPSPREPERQDEIPRDSRPEQERRVRLSIPVPRLVDEVLRRSGRDPQDEINRVVGALFRKLTPQRGPSDKGPYAGEVHYFQRLLDATPVAVSQLGAEHRAYGHYFGDTVARDDYPDRIVVYQDTLERDFGHDPDLLRAQVERTLRHELAHHLGWHERGVRDLGL